MKVLLQQIKQQSQGKPGSVLFIGAGNGSHLQALRELDARQMVLTEAHPRLADELAQRIQADAGEALWHRAITTQPDATQATLHVLNNARYSSLAVPTQLLQHLPNLRASHQIPVPAQNMASAIDALKLDAQESNTLILEAPGQTLALLRAAKPEALQQFNWIVVSTSPEALYENDAPEADVKAYLAEIGFDNPVEDPDALYPYNRLLLKRNEEFVRLQCLQQSLRQAQNERDQHAATLKQQQTAQAALAQELEASQAQVSSLQAERDKQLAEVDKQQKLVLDLRQELDAGTRFAAERETALNKVAQEGIEQTKQLAALRQEQQGGAEKIKALSSELDASKAQIASLKADLAKQSAETDKQQKLAAEREAALNKAAQERTEQAKQLAAAQQQQKDSAAKLALQSKALEADKAQTSTLQADLSKQTEEAATQQKLVADLRKQLEASTKLATERDAASKKAAQERDEQAKQLAAAQQQQKDTAAKLAAQAKELEAAKQAGAQHEAAAKKTAQERDAQKQQLATSKQAHDEQTARLRELEAEAQNSTIRQQLLQEELIKAEAQIELIKDLLLREPGL